MRLIPDQIRALPSASEMCFNDSSKPFQLKTDSIAKTIASPDQYSFPVQEHMDATEIVLLGGPLYL